LQHDFILILDATLLSPILLHEHVLYGNSWLLPIYLLSRHKIFDPNSTCQTYPKVSERVVINRL